MAFIYYVTHIQFEFGAVKLLRQECERVGITRPLVVTDPGVAATGAPHEVAEQIRATGVEAVVYDGARVEPTDASLVAAPEALDRQVGVHVAQRVGAALQVVVGLGEAAVEFVAELLADQTRG